MSKAREAFFCHIDGKAVHCDPLLNTYTNGCDILSAKPDTGMKVDRVQAGDTQAFSHAKHIGFKSGYIAANIPVVLTKVDDGISRQLTWPVVGHIPTAICAIEGDALVAE